MFNLFDILQQQAGPGMQAVGQQFGLSSDQSRRATEALLPALAAGLQRSAASDPMGFGRFLGLAGATPFLPGQPQPAPQPDLIAQLLGASPLNQAVLQQAAAASGIGAQALRQMLPVMAGMVVAGIVHVLVNQTPAPTVVRRETPPEPGFPVATFWNDWVNGMLAASAPAAAEPARPRETAASRPAPPVIKPSPEPETVTSSMQEDAGAPEAAADAPFEVFQEMFRSGVQVQEQNAKAMQDIFDAFWSPPPEGEAAPDRDGPPDAASVPRKRPASTAKRRQGPAGRRPTRKRNA